METLKVVITIKKEDLPKFIDKFQVEEYTVNTKRQEVTIDMTTLFDAAMKQYTEEVKGDKPTDTSADLAF